MKSSGRCPVDPEHGPVIAVTGGKWGWYCTHAEHDGRLRSHPDGEAPATRAFFTTAEVDEGRLEERLVAG